MPVAEQIAIEKLVAGGYGLGRCRDGMIALVPYVLPGETVRVLPGKKKKKYLEAELVEVIRPSPHRIKPRCHHFQQCGGCDLQHADYLYQLTLKEEIFAELLIRNRIVPPTAIKAHLAAARPAANAYGYRQRVRLQVDGRGRLGFHRFHSHALEAISCCPLARPEINAVLGKLPDNPHMAQLLTHTKAVEIIVSPDDSSVVLLLHFTRKPRPADERAAAEVKRSLAGASCLLLSVEGFGLFGPFPQTADGEKPLIRFTLPGAVTGGQDLAMTLEPGGFCQVNQEQNEKFVELLLSWAGRERLDRVLDLYCGMGNFSIPLALLAGEVVGMDLQRSAIRSAVRNATLNGLDNVRFEKNSAMAGARELARQRERFDLILLDPPRRGCADVLPYIADLGARRIVYISCDPATLARDLSTLQQTGYTLRKIRLIDMFPQTHHMETITLLEK